MIAVMLLCCWAPAVMGTPAAASGDFLQGALHPGVHMTQISTYVFRSTITTHYVLEMPVLESPTFRPQRMAVCNGQEQGKNILLCRFVNGTNTLMKDLAESTTSLLSSMQVDFSSENRPKRGALDFLWKGVFGIASDSDVRQVMTSETQMYERLKEMNFLVKMQNMDERSLVKTLNMWTDSVSNVTSEILDHAEGLEVLMREGTKVNEELAAYAAAAGGTLTAQLLLLSHFVRENSILTDCGRGRIPFEGIPVKEFQNNLRAMSSILDSKNLSLSIPPNDLFVYANGNIASCKRSKSKLLISIALPVMPRGDMKVTAHKVVPLNFRYNDQHCKLLDETKVVLWNPLTRRVFILDEKSGNDCIRDKVCLIPRVATQNALVDCLSGIMNGQSLGALREICHFYCDRDLPRTRVTDIGNDVFSISTLSSKLSVECAGKDPQNLNANTVGAMEVTIPCECQLVADGIPFVERSINCRSNASDTSSIKFTLPALWSQLVPQTLNFPDAKEKGFTLMHGNMSDFLNSDWKLNISHIDLPNPGPALEDDFWKKPDFGLPYTGVVWKSVLTLVVVFLLIRVCRVGNRFYGLRSALRDALRREARHADIELGTVAPSLERSHGTEQ